MSIWWNLLDPYGDKYILNHEDGEKYIRWGKLERDLKNFQSLESENAELKKKLSVAVEALSKITGVGIPTGCELEIAEDALKSIESNKGEME